MSTKPVEIDMEDVAIAAGQNTEMVNTINRLFEIQPHHFVLEAGSGTGKLGISMNSQFGCHVVLVDNDSRPLQVSQRLKWCVEGLRGVDIPVLVKYADILKLPYLDDSFHLVFNEGVVEHFRPPSLVVKEMIRVSKDAVAVIAPNADNAKQVALAKDQTEHYKDRPGFWASYEKPMLQEEMRAMLEDELKLKEVFTTLMWAEPRPPKSRDDFRMVFGFGRKRPAT